MLDALNLDLTEAAEAFRRNSLFGKTLNKGNFVFWVIDLEGKIKYLTGPLSKDFNLSIGQLIQDVLPEVQDTFSNIIKSEEENGMVFLECKNSYYLINYAKIADAFGNVTSIGGIATSIPSHSKLLHILGASDV